jgi:hypothetical protein
VNVALTFSECFLSEIVQIGVSPLFFADESMIDEFNEIVGKASAKEQYSAAVAALTAKAKLAGLWVDRAENINGNYAISDKPLSEQEWVKRHVKERISGLAWRSAAEKPDHRHWRLLRTSRQRPCSRAGERGYQFTSSNMDCHATLPRGS